MNTAKQYKAAAKATSIEQLVKIVEPSRGRALNTCSRILQDPGPYGLGGLAAFRDALTESIANMLPEFDRLADQCSGETAAGVLDTTAVDAAQCVQFVTHTDIPARLSNLARALFFAAQAVELKRAFLA